MRKKYSWATLIFVLGCLIKQSVWFLLPFYFIYIYFQEKNNKKLLIKQFLIFFIVAAIVILPFIIWDHVSFFDDTVRYLSGKSTTSYPMAGYGFGQLLLLNNLVKSSDYFPFWIFQLVAGLPVLIFLIKKQKEMNNLSTIILSYVMFLFVVWYFSRYFTVTHLVFIIQLLLLGVFLKFEEKNKIKN
jgi:hypothetical protein